MRLRIPERRRDEAFFGRVRQRLSQWPGVIGVEVNPITAGVLVHFDSAAEDFAGRARDDDLFDLVELAPEPRPIVEEIREGFEGVDRKLRRLTGGGDLRTLVFAALLAGAVYQLVRGNIAAPAVSLFWYAGEMLRIWAPPPEIAPAPAADVAPT
jgi:hypothetical protein